MRELVAATDWGRTAIGARERWPQALRIAVDICLNSRFPMFVWWGPALINIYNDAYVPVLGERHPVALGRPAQEIWHEIWPVIGPQAEAVMTRGEATWNERVLLVMERHGFTEETWFTWSYSPIHDETGQVAGLFCACSEETQRVLAERERDRLAAQRQVALDAAAMGWWHYDAGTRTMICDARCREILGLSGAGRPQEEIARRVHPEDLSTLAAQVAGALSARDATSHSAEYRVLRNGEVRWVEAHGTASFNGDGPARRAVSFVGTVADITARRRGEEARGRLAAIVESSDDAIISKSLDGIILTWNAGAERLFGYRADEAVGRSITMLLPPERVEEEAGILTRLRAGEHIEHFESVRMTKDGRLIDVSLSISPVRDEAGRIIGASKVARDITRQKRAARELQAAKAAAERNLARWQAVVGDMAEGVIVADARGALTEWNAAALRMHGYARAEDARRELHELVETFELTTADGQVVAFEDWPMSRVLRGERFLGREMAVRRLDTGVRRIISYSGSPVRDRERTVVLATLTLHDVTEERDAQAAVRRSEAKFRSLIEQSAAGIAQTA